MARTVEIGMQPRGGLVQHFICDEGHRAVEKDVVGRRRSDRRGQTRGEMRQIGEAVQMQKAEQADRATGRLA